MCMNIDRRTGKEISPDEFAEIAIEAYIAKRNRETDTNVERYASCERNGLMK